MQNMSNPLTSAVGSPIPTVTRRLMTNGDAARYAKVRSGTESKKWQGKVRSESLFFILFIAPATTTHFHRNKEVCWKMKLFVMTVT